MREGQNPEKSKGVRISLKKHRVIMVFYIPHDYTLNDYYEQAIEILDISLNSLINTVNLECTAITVINNNSSKDSEVIVSKHMKYIDKYIYYSCNKGKVNPVLNEARSAYEEFITITDADILFYPGWEIATFNLFKNFKNVGAVSPYPSPYTSFYVNKSSFGFNYLFRRVKYCSMVAEKDIDFYCKGVDLPFLYRREESEFNWKEKQYILKSNNEFAVIGSFHVVGTYRTQIFRNEYEVPDLVFKNSYEEKFIDFMSDKSGLIKLSTLKSYIYHIGNKLDYVVKDYKDDMTLNKIDLNFFNEIKPQKRKSKIYIFINRLLGFIIIKYIK